MLSSVRIELGTSVTQVYKDVLLIFTKSVQESSIAGENDSVKTPLVALAMALKAEQLT